MLMMLWSDTKKTHLVSFVLPLLLALYLISFSSQEGRAAPDNNIGRFIADTVASVPKIPPAAFDKILNDRLQVMSNSHIFLVSVLDWFVHVPEVQHHWASCHTHGDENRYRNA